MPSITGVVRIEKKAAISHSEKNNVVLSYVLYQLKKEKINNARTEPARIPSI